MSQLLRFGAFEFYDDGKSDSIKSIERDNDLKITVSPIIQRNLAPGHTVEAKEYPIGVLNNYPQPIFNHMKEQVAVHPTIESLVIISDVHKNQTSPLGFFYIPRLKNAPVIQDPIAQEDTIIVERGDRIVRVGVLDKSKAYETRGHYGHDK